MFDRVRVAPANAVRPVVVRHQRRVVGEARVLDQLERLGPERPVRRAEAERRPARRADHRLDRPIQDAALRLPIELGEVLVVPAMACQLVAISDYYVTLGVERTASDAEIKKAFRRLAQQWHRT